MIRPFSDRRLTTSIYLLGGMLAAVLLASVFTPFSPNEIHLDRSLQPPAGPHLLGSDVLGRDVMTRILSGARASLAISISAVLGGMAIGGLLALASGYLGGILDVVFTRIVDILLAIPPLLIAIGIVAIAGSSGPAVATAIGIGYAPTFARIVRSSVVATRALPYVEATIGIGAPSTYTVVKDILPAVLPTMIVTSTTAVAWALLDEAYLGFLGLGVQPPDTSWGSLLIEGREYLFQAPWIALSAGFAVLVAVMTINLIGDRLQDALDPRSSSVSRGTAGA